ncbi:MAG: hypothetical protein HY982_02490, partial [Candidatus Magasanikbacteria bacterium]|nr:hypothetical protein [Candidatus Magasanikbacteria bacterium]
GWRFCQDEKECPKVDISVMDSGNSPDDIFSVYLDKKFIADVIPKIKDGKQQEKNYPARSALNFQNMPKESSHSLEIYNKTGGGYGTGKITFKPDSLSFDVMPKKAYTSGDVADLWPGNPPTAFTDEEMITKQSNQGVNFRDFQIALPQECGPYWSDWLDIFLPSPPNDQKKFEKDYPCVSSPDPGYIIYEFTVK